MTTTGDTGAFGCSFDLRGCLKPSGSGESPGHGRDHGEVDHGFVVVGSGFVVARAAAVLVDPRETSLDYPNAEPDVETSGAGDAFDDLHSKGENVFRPDAQPAGVTDVGTDQPDGGEAA